jgi:hypothetical protein
LLADDRTAVIDVAATSASTPTRAPTWALRRGPAALRGDLPAPLPRDIRLDRKIVKEISQPIASTVEVSFTIGQTSNI